MIYSLRSVELVESCKMEISIQSVEIKFNRYNKVSLKLNVLGPRTLLNHAQFTIESKQPSVDTSYNPLTALKELS